VNIETLLRELGELRAENNARLERIERVLGQQAMKTSAELALEHG
jgi:hypothetical protein